MKGIGPLLITFAFFAVLFLIGRLLQEKEKERRKTKSAEARALEMLRKTLEKQRPERQEPTLPERPGMPGAFSGSGQKDLRSFDS